MKYTFEPRVTLKNSPCPRTRFTNIAQKPNITYSYKTSPITHNNRIINNNNIIGPHNNKKSTETENI